jgi:hypothetical protein
VGPREGAPRLVDEDGAQAEDEEVLAVVAVLVVDRVGEGVGEGDGLVAERTTTVSGMTAPREPWWYSPSSLGNTTSYQLEVTSRSVPSSSSGGEI